MIGKLVNSAKAGQLPAGGDDLGVKNNLRCSYTSLLKTVGLQALAVDEKDVNLTPQNLRVALAGMKVPNLFAANPIIANYAADGAPRIEGQAWAGEGADAAHATYDPSDPDTLVTYGIVADDKGFASIPFVGFRIDVKAFDTELGATTIALRGFYGDKDHEVFSHLLSLDAPTGHIYLPIVRPSFTRRSVAMPTNFITEGGTLEFSVKDVDRAETYDITVFEGDAEAEASKTSIPFYFTISGINAYTYVQPIFAHVQSVPTLLAHLSKDVCLYLDALSEVAHQK